MSCPTEGIESAAYGNNIESVREALELKHGKNYRIYNLANRTYRKERLAQVIDLGMQLSASRAPNVTFMLKICLNIRKYLNENSKNICVINCNDGRIISAVAVSTLMMYFNLIKNVDSCLKLFYVRRATVNLIPSQYRYLKDTQKLLLSIRHESNTQVHLSPNECLLTSIVLATVPLFNKSRFIKKLINSFLVIYIY